MFQYSPPKLKKGLIYKSSEDILPSLRKKPDLRLSKDKEKIPRRVIRHDVLVPYRDDQSRPGTPVVGTRLERYASGSRKHQIPYETADMYTNNGMYKLPQKGSATSRREKRDNLLSANRCSTPLPIDKPLTKLCWNNHKEIINSEDSDDEELDNLLNVRRQHDRYLTASTLKLHRNCHDVTVSDLENDFSAKPHEPLQLTQKVLQTLRSDNVNKNQRILQWLVDCEEKNKFTASQLPSHLPDITINSRHISSASPNMVRR